MQEKKPLSETKKTRILYKMNDNWIEIEVDELVVIGEQLSTLYKSGMNTKQQSILELSKKEDISKMTLREIGKKSGIGDKPQIVKHHILQLKKKNFM